MGNTEDRKLALERLRVRAEMRSIGDDENSAVIEQEALSRRPKSVPTEARGLVAILNTLPQGWGRVVVVLALIVAVATLIAGGKIARWF